MKRAVVLALLLAALPARAQRIWQDFENTGGYTSPATSACFLYVDAPFDERCYASDGTLAITGSTAGVVGFYESSGPTLLTYGAIANGQCMERSGSSVVGTTCGGGAVSCADLPAFSGGDLLSGGGTCAVDVQGLFNTLTATDYGFGPWTNGECLAIDAVSNTILSTPCAGGGGGGTVTSVSGGTAISISGTPTVAPVVNAKVDATSITVNGSNQLQRGALGGDLSAAAGSNTVNVTALESAANAKGYVDWTAIAAPANPSGGDVRLFNFSGVGQLASLDASGTARYLEKDVTCAASKWANKTLAGTLTCTQPAFSDLSGSVTCGQLPALTNDVSSSAGSCSVNVTALEAGAAAKGSVVATEIATPAAPGAGKIAVYAGTQNILYAENPFGGTTHTVATTTCAANTWGNAIDAFGGFNCTQPAFSSLTGSATCGQLPALTGGVTSSAGSCATTVASVPCSALPSLTGGVTSSAGSCSTTVASVPCGATPAYTGDITKSAGSCTTVNPTKGKALATSSDPTPDYLANKIESTTSTLTVTSAGGGTLVDENVNLDKVFTIVLPHHFGNYATQVGWCRMGGPNAESCGDNDRTEYPIGLSAGHVSLVCSMFQNNITSGNFTYTATHNGSTTLASLTFTSASGTGTFTSTATVTPATTDTWGLKATSIGSALLCDVTHSISCIDVACSIQLRP